MSAYLLILLAIPLFLMLGFSGCVGDDPELVAAQKEAKDQKERADQIADKAKQDQAATDKAKEDRKYSNVVLATANLVSLWRLSSGNNGSSVAEDSAPDMPQNGEFKGAGINKDVQGALALVADPTDKAVAFDGTTGLVEVPFHLLLNPPLSFSLELWVKPDSFTGTKAVLSSCEVKPTGEVIRGYLVEVITDPAPTLQVRLGFVTGEAVFTTALGDGSEHGGWRHVVFTYESDVKRARLYVNSDSGVADLEKGGPGQDPVFFVSNAANHLRIAAGSTPTNTPTAFFKGAIDEVALYSQAIAGSDVRNHFTIGTSVPA